MAERHTTTLVINPGSGNGPSTDGGSSQTSVSVTTSASASFSSSTQVAKSASTSKSITSTSSRTVSSSSTVKKTSTSSVKKMSVTSSSMTSSNNLAIKSSGDSFLTKYADDFGFDVQKEMDKMKISMDEAVKKAKEEMFSLTKLEKISGGPSSDVIKLDSKSVMDFVDKQDNDKLRFNFDVDEFESESISVKAVGNQIEVHGKKSVKKGDDETNEEFSRTYEMPTDGSIDSDKITTSIFKDGVLSVELPFDTKALKDKQ